MVRNYKREYMLSGKKPNEKKNRASRNKVRRALTRNGTVRKGDRKDIDHIDQDGHVWSYVIRYNKNDNDLAVLHKKRYGKKLVFCKRGEL